MRTTRNQLVGVARSREPVGVKAGQADHWHSTPPPQAAASQSGCSSGRRLGTSIQSEIECRHAQILWRHAPLATSSFASQAAASQSGCSSGCVPHSTARPPPTLAASAATPPPGYLPVDDQDIERPSRFKTTRDSTRSPIQHSAAAADAGAATAATPLPAEVTKGFQLESHQTFKISFAQHRAAAAHNLWHKWLHTMCKPYSLQCCCRQVTQ